MNDQLIFCPQCKEYRKFIISDKYVRIFELSNNDKEKIRLISCKECDYPIGVLPSL